jgi:hypothetical protein
MEPEKAVAGKQCRPYELAGGLSESKYRNGVKNKGPILSKIQDYVMPLANFLNEKLDSATTCLISPGLESNLSPQEARNIVDVIKPMFPKCQIVWNPEHGGPAKWADYHELHGYDARPARPCILNLDGNDVEFGTSKLDSYIEEGARCRSNYLWHHTFNLQVPNKWTDPRNRVGFPTPQIFQKLRQEFARGEPAPAIPVPGCVTFHKVNDGAKKGFLWKQSDVHPGAVAMLPAKFKDFKSVIVAKGDEVISTLKFSGRYNEDKSNRQMWRSQKPAKDFPKNVVLKAKGNCWKIKDPTVRND